jgi:hypothetical protein
MKAGIKKYTSIFPMQKINHLNIYFGGRRDKEE